MKKKQDKIDYDKKYNQRPEIIERKRKSYQENKEEKKAFGKKYYQENKEEINQKAKIKNQKPEIKEKRKEYEQLPKSKERRKIYNQRPEVKEKAKVYRQRPDVDKRRKEYIKIYSKKPEAKLRVKEYEKEYRKKLEVKEKAKVYYKKHYQENKEEIKQKFKEYYQEQGKKENKRRKKLGVALIGEGFKKEMELLVYVHSLFQNYDILTHHRKLLGDWGRVGLELDIYIPKLKLAFEYNGIQHYKFNYFFHTKEEFEYQRYKDRCKKRICKLKGITLIKIRYDEKLSEQLVLTKLKYIPSLIKVQGRL